MNEISRHEQVFAAALALPPGERKDYLAQAHGGDLELLARVEALFCAYDEIGILTQNSTPATLSQSQLPEDRLPLEGPGDKIGHYKLLEKIGEGGCGVVYKARQEEPVRRDVALKVIKLGMDTKAVIARFEAERQALALMSHPNIAQVFDAGATRLGRPYFVMELVEGAKITTYCDEHKLCVPERLDLFLDACRAVQHAHQKGIIHRDIKPSNIIISLQDNKPRPKIIDFGIAKATQGRLTDVTLVTTMEQLIGTPAYMSPEQTEMCGVDVDTRSDIYSLGVLFYELLNGCTPFDAKELARASIDTMRRRIREEAPPRPSARLAALPAEMLEATAACRGTTPVKLAHAIHGDLDWIVMRCLEKDPARRYETVGELAGDLQRYLQHEPIVARPPNLLDAFRKFARRNRLVLTVGAVIIAVLAAATAVSLELAVRATKAEKQAETARTEEESQKKMAETEAANSQAVLAFLRNDFMTQASPNKQSDPDLKLRTALDIAAGKIKNRFAKQPLVEAQIRTTLAETYVTLGEYVAMQKQLEKALAIYQQQLGPEDPKTLNATRELINSYRLQGKFRETEALGLPVLKSHQQAADLKNPNIIAIMYGLVTTYNNQGKMAESEALLRSALEMQKQTLGPENQRTLQTMSYLGYTLWREGKFAEAEALEIHVLDVRNRLLGPENPDTLDAMTDLTVVLEEEERFAEAEALFRRAIDSYKRVLGPKHPETLHKMFYMAQLFEKDKKWAEAEKLYRQTLGLREQVLGPKHPLVLNTMADLARTLDLEGKLAEAEKLSTQTVASYQQSRGLDNDLTLRAMDDLAIILSKEGKWAEAEKLGRQTLAISKQTFDSDGSYALDALHQLALVLRNEGKLAEAEALQTEIADACKQQISPESPDALSAIRDLAITFVLEHRFAEAEAMQRRAWEAYKRVLGPDRRSTLLTMGELAGTFKEEGKWSDAEALFAQTFDLQKRALGPEHPDTLMCADRYGSVLLQLGKFAEAEPLLRQNLDGRMKVTPDSWRVSYTQSELGAALAGLKRFAEAEPFITGSYENLEKRANEIPIEEKSGLSETGDRLGQFYTDWGKPEKAMEWKQKFAEAKLPVAAGSVQAQ